MSSSNSEVWNKILCFLEILGILFIVSDPRTKNYYLIQDSPLPVAAIILAYLGMCKYGPVLMKDRKPFELRSLMTIYNFIQFVINFGFGFYVSKNI